MVGHQTKLEFCQKQVEYVHRAKLPSGDKERTPARPDQTNMSNRLNLKLVSRPSLWSPDPNLAGSSGRLWVGETD